MNVAGRMILGLIAGVILGSIAELLTWSEPDEPRVRFPVIGMTLGATIGIAFGIVVGGKKIEGKTLFIIKGILIGTVAGLIAGTLYGKIMTNATGVPIHSQFAGGYTIDGITIGLPLGTGIGAFIGLMLGMRKRRMDLPVLEPRPRTDGFGRRLTRDNNVFEPPSSVIDENRLKKGDRMEQGD